MNRRRLIGFALLVGAVVSAVGCGSWARGSRGQATYPLVVNNRSDFEVVVYALPSQGSNGIRLGNSRAFTTSRMNIPRNALQGASFLVLRLHTIGTNQAWTSPGTTVDSSVVAQLDIRVDPYGGLSHSALYTELAHQSPGSTADGSTRVAR